MNERMNQVIALVEPSFYGVSFVKSAFHKGYKVVVIVQSKENPCKYGYEGYFHDFITADIRSTHSILEAIQSSPYHQKLDALIPATDFASHITAKVAEELGLKNVTYEAALNARNKDLAKAAFEQHHIPCAKYHKVKSYEEAKTTIEDLKFPVVVKPTNAASSQGVHLVTNERELKLAFEQLKSFTHTYLGFSVRDDYLVEEYLDGKEYSVEIFLENGETILSVVTEKTVSKPPYFVETAHVMPAMIDQNTEKEIINTAVQALFAIGLINGPSHVEIKVTAEGSKVIEVNGRPGGDMISSDLLLQTKGINVFDATIDFYMNVPIDLQPNLEKGAAIVYLTAEKEGRLDRLTNIENLKNDPYVVRSAFNVNPGDNIDKPRSSDDRLGYIITVHDSPESAKQHALTLMQSVGIHFKSEASISL